MRIAVAMVSGSVDGVPEHDRSRAGRLETPHLRAAGWPRRRARPRGRCRRGVLAVALPVGRDVAGVADRQQWMSGASPSASTTSKARGLLALDAGRVDRVDQLDGVGLGELAGQGEAVVEVAVDLEQGRAVRDGLAELAHRDLAVGHEHGARHPGLGGVGRRAGAGVAGGRADDGLGAVLGRQRDRGRHAAVLERRGRVQALELDEHVGPGELGEVLAGMSGVPPSWRVTTGAPSSIGRRSAYSRITPRHWCATQAPSTRMTEATSSTVVELGEGVDGGRRARRPGAVWVTTMSLARASPGLGVAARSAGAPSRWRRRARRTPSRPGRARPGGRPRRG